MLFDPLQQPYSSNRYCITAQHGVVATGSSLASAAGLAILRKGGNAVDAAVATAAALTVVEPTANGIGSDAFAIVWMKDQMYGLNASGRAPKNASLQGMQQHAVDGKMPRYGWKPVMVPGCVKGWVELIKRFGNLTLEEVLAPAIDYAENGYPISPALAKQWARATEIYKKNFGEEEAFQEWFRTFTKKKEPYSFGEMVQLKNHAKTLRLIAQTNGKAFYEGEIAEQFIKQSQRDGGYFCKEDLSTYDIEWVDPISVSYRGYDVWEIPPNGQGLVALMALNTLKEFSFETKESVDTYHKQFEAMKMAFTDGLHHITDATKMSVDVQSFLTDTYGKVRASQITEEAQKPDLYEPPKGGTVYLATADEEGNMVSYIQSNYMGFGSGIVLEGYGVSLQNRGADFSLNPDDANCFEGGKKSYHTIIPGFLTKGNRAIGPFGVMGGYMQPQGHVQVIMNLLDFHLNPQMALDAPRWQWLKGLEFGVERQMDETLVEELKKKGHEVSYREDIAYGRGQIIWRLENGVYVVGTESRTDSNIACY